MAVVASFMYFFDLKCTEQMPKLLAVFTQVVLAWKSCHATGAGVSELELELSSVWSIRTTCLLTHAYKPFKCTCSVHSQWCLIMSWASICQRSEYGIGTQWTYTRVLKREDLDSMLIQRQVRSNLHTPDLHERATYKLFRGARGNPRSSGRK